ncbi:MAG: malectin domain-containing carbohydrate-binding protein [Ginsengibacter sp.]
MKKIYRNLISDFKFLRSALATIAISASVLVANAQNCSPVSSFSCPAIVKSIPFSLTFSGSEGGLLDKQGIGTGFFMATNPSAPLFTPSNSLVPGYEPSKLYVNNGQLFVTSTAGISYLNPAQSSSTNSQVNALGVGIKTLNTTIIEATLNKPLAGTNLSEQGGIYFGLNEDNYVKLDVISAGSGYAQVEFLTEVGAVSASTNNIKGPKLILSNSIIKLKLVVNPAADSVTAYYIVNGGAEVTLAKVAIPSSFSDGQLLSDGTTGGISFAGIFTSNRKSSTPLVFTFDDFNITEIKPAPVANTLSFSPAVLNYTVVESGTVASQYSTLSVNQGNPQVTFSQQTVANWLVVPTAAIGTPLSFSINASGLTAGKYSTIVKANATSYPTASLAINLQVTSPSNSKSILFTQASQTAEVEQGSSQSLLEYISTSDNYPTSVQLTAKEPAGNVPTWLNVNGSLLNGVSYTTGSEISFNFDATNLSIGQYAATVNATAAGYTNGVLEITLNVNAAAAGQLTTVKINFQDSVTVPPAGYLKDFGQAFGPRTSSNQGSGYNYGWLTTAKAPLDLTKNGRKRTTPSNILLATLMHMQANDIASFSGTKTEGIWEIQVENGNYDVKVAVGDITAIDSKHSVNVEGISAINGFIPSSTIKFDSAIITVTVADGFLTVDASGGKNTKINFINIAPSTGKRPSVVLVNPENASQNVSENSSISTSILKLPNGGIDNSTIVPLNVYLKEEASGIVITANVNGTGGGDAITLTPTAPLKLSTTYVFTITGGVKDLLGFSFIPYTSKFTTGSGSSSEVLNAKFEKVMMPGIKGQHSSVTMGPDGKLYALGIDGIIKRFTIKADGTLDTTNVQLIYSLQDASGTRTPRLAIGLAFDPASTASNLIAWITNSTFVFLNGPDWDGKLTKLSGPNLATVQDVLINLPRSAKDHLTNSIAFGPDGALYFTQGSNSAMGKADKTWGYREEHLLSGAVLRLNTKAMGATLPLSVKTSEGGGTYSPYQVNAPLTIYASGVRNAYDLVWHSNGKLYVATNGSAAGGNTPASVNGTLRPDGTAYNGPTVPALTNVQQTQKDFLFRIEKGGFYGHPNSLRGQYVMNGGNPTSAIDPAEVPTYPLGTLPDANYRGYAFDFQTNKSPNGSIEYKGNNFNGALKGKLMIVRYSQNDDIITLTPGGPDKDIISAVEGAFVPGLSGFNDPLDITQDSAKGNLYVSEYGGEGTITLLRAVNTTTTANGTITVTPRIVYDNDVTGGAVGNKRIITIKNTGAGTLTVSNVSLAGTNANQYVLYDLPVFPKAVTSGSSITFSVAFNPSSVGLKTASIVIGSNDALTPSSSVSLRSLGTAGLGGSNEPSLQSILTLKEISVTVGDDDASTALINSNATLQKAALLGEEISIQRFQKAGSGLVTIEPISVFGPTDSAIVTSLGWYKSGDITSAKQLFSVSNNPLTNGQTVNPEVVGTLSFDPLGETFGFYSKWPYFKNRILYSEDKLNIFAGAIPHHVRVYPYKVNGNVIANAYIVAFEETTSGIDFQDIVFIVRNVKSENAVNSLLFVENPDKFPSNDNLTFSRIQVPWGRDSVKNRNHDSINLRIHNKGVSALTIKNLFLGDKTLFTILKIKGLNYDSTTAFPITITSGSFIDVTIKFVAVDQSTRVKICVDSLTIVSNDAKLSTKIVYLRGIWQKQGEGTYEPYAQEVITAFGFKTKTGFGKNDPNSGDPRYLRGDEILSSYFVRADDTKPISIRQMAAYHGCCTATERIMWHTKGSTTLNTVFTHSALDGQSVLPKKNGSTTAAAEGNITTSAVIGFKVGGKDWTDTTFNPERKIGIRVWKAIDADGNLIPNNYIIGNDYLGSDFTNYDYQDNIYYVKNIKPETGTSYSSELVSSPSALDFGQKVLQTIDSLRVTITNNGKIYANGSKDPALTISSIKIVGDNQTEFAFASPFKTLLAPQEFTTIAVAFKPVTEGLKIADLLVKYTNSPTPLRIPLYGIAKLNTTTVTLHQRINSGSAKSVTLNGKIWAADTVFAHDNLEPYTNPLVTELAASDEDTILRIEQSSNADKRPFRYEFPIANGNYIVRLHFAELYWGNAGTGLTGGPGSRVMTVALEGTQRLINLDVAQEVGSAAALVKNVGVVVNDGKLNIDFSATVNRPMVCGIEVYSFSTGAGLMSSQANLDSAIIIGRRYGSINVVQPFAKLKMYPNPVKRKFAVNFPASYVGNNSLQIIDPAGRIYELGNTRTGSGKFSVEMDISKYGFKAGLYLLRVTNASGHTEILKFIIE